jgi:hypothetical protein
MTCELACRQVQLMPDRVVQLGLELVYQTMLKLDLSADQSTG